MMTCITVMTWLILMFMAISKAFERCFQQDHGVNTQGYGYKDPEQVWDHRPEQNDEYGRMKYMTPKQFKDICNVGVNNYNRSKKE